MRALPSKLSASSAGSDVTPASASVVNVQPSKFRAVRISSTLWALFVAMSTSFTGSSLQTGTSPVRAVAYSAGRSTCATTSMGRASTRPPKRRNSSTSSAVVKNEWTGTLPERAWARRRRRM